jgi:GNAT superfamily N-acetyltransferase
MGRTLWRWLSGMLVRKLTIDDLGAYRALHRHGLQHAPQAFVETVEQDQARSDEEVAAVLRRGEGWGVFDGERLLGKLIIDRLPYAVLAHTRWLHAIYLHPDARGAGAGAKLVQAAIDDARAAGAFCFLLWVNSQNRPARRFYEKLGFEEAGRVNQGLAMGGGFVDDVLMQLNTAKPAGSI